MTVSDMKSHEKDETVSCKEDKVGKDLHLVKLSQSFSLEEFQIPQNYFTCPRVALGDLMDDLRP